MLPSLPEITYEDRPTRILDFDIETVAAGFADPAWVPQDVTCIAWSWIGEEKVSSVTRLDGAEKMLVRFLEEYERADILTGHNIIRFDLPVLNAEVIRHGLPALGPKMVQDTMRLPKSKGLKKGQDVLGKMLGTPTDKLPLNWWEWRDAYNEPGWKTVVLRCEGDVIQHKQIRQRMQERNLLAAPRIWRP